MAAEPDLAVRRPDLAVRRPFQWGILILTDKTSTGTSWPEMVRGAPFAATPSCIVAAVRHAQDTDSDPTLAPDDVVPPYEVSLRCWVNQQPTSETTFNANLKLPSGAFQLGDAERWDTIALPSGDWHIQIATYPPDHPEQIDLWLNTTADAMSAGKAKSDEHGDAKPPTQHRQQPLLNHHQQALPDCHQIAMQATAITHVTMLLCLSRGNFAGVADKTGTGRSR